MRPWRVVLVCAAASACAVPANPPPAVAPPPAEPPLRVVALPPPPISRPPAEAPPVIDAPPDYCGASTSQSLIGLNRSEIPPPIDASRRRVTCTECPITRDYRPDRLNIFFDEQTGVIEEVRCG